MNTILYIKENNQFNDLVMNTLATEFKLLMADDIEDGLVSLMENEVDVVIIDCEFIDARIEMCRSIRSSFAEYIPILLASSTDSVEIIQRSLDTGADSCLNLTKMHPILRSELSALIRRTSRSKKDELRLSGIGFDHNELSVVNGGIKVSMKRREYQILNYLVINRGMIISRERIIEKFWDDRLVNSNTIDVHITRIRQKLGQLGGSFRIDSVYGLGYKFVVREE